MLNYEGSKHVFSNNKEPIKKPVRCCLCWRGLKGIEGV